MTQVPKDDPITKLQSLDLGALWSQVQTWLVEHVFNQNSLYQIILIAAAFVAASILFGLMRDNMKSAIEKSDMTARGKRMSRGMTKLLLPFLTLGVIFFLTQIAGSDLVGMDVWLINGMMKVLLAWIIIRAMVQFIDNGLIRNVFSITIWLIAALSIFGVLDQTSTTLESMSLDIGDFKLSLLAVVKSLFFIFILMYLASVGASLAEQKLAHSRHLTKSSQVLIAKIIRIALFVLALLIAITSSGIDLSVFAVLGGAIGLGIGLGLQKGVANLFSGMTLLLDKSIQPGDFIELDNGTVGKIQRMAARYTEVVTLDNKSILIPNEEFITKPVINWSHGSRLVRVSVNFGVHYNSDPHEVIRMSVEAAKKPARVLTKPNMPVCFMAAFADSAINFTLVFWIEDPENGIGNIKGEVLLALWDAFKENGVQIPYPHREVFIHKVD